MVDPMAGEGHRWETNTPYRQNLNVEFIERRVEVREGGWGRSKE